MKFWKTDFEKYKRPYTLEIKKKRYFYFFIKRIFDIIFSLLAIVVMSPLFIIVALIVFIDDPHGSPIFKQKRVGQHGTTFNFYKFRSMCVDAEEQLKDIKHLNEAEGPVFKIKDDPRITKIGHFIRNTSIDELPQLFNVLKGNMSLVGPRPSLPREVVHYDDYQKQRLMTKSGLTCFWQVYPGRHDISFSNWVALDIKYAEEQSFSLDLKLIIKTFSVVFSCKAD